MSRIRGKTAVVTGASSGIGRAVALEMARRGANVVLAARRAGNLEEVAAQCRAIGVTATVVPTDVTDPVACRRLIAAAGEPDILVNNAGFAVLDTVGDADVAVAREMMNVNYFGALHCTQAVLPGMLARGRGTIVNVGSIVGLMGFTRMGVYGATKAALACLTEALRDEVAPHGIRVALVCPGTTESEFFVRADRSKLPGASRLLRAIQPERVARAVSDAAEDGRYRRILPLLAAVLIRLKEVFPATVHLIARTTSTLLERK